MLATSVSPAPTERRETVRHRRVAPHPAGGEMAEIKVEQKRGGTPWLWVIIALLVIALLVWYFVFNNRGAGTPSALAVPSRAELLALLHHAALAARSAVA